MNKLRLYIDTSVIGGCYDEEFKTWSDALFRDIDLGRFAPVVSTIVSEEISKAPPWVRDKYTQLLQYGVEMLEPNAACDELMQAYLPAVKLSAKHSNDMLHIAMATMTKVDVLVSWNFKHIVHLDKMRAFNAVNLQLGYQPIQILSPREVAHEE